MTQGPTWLKNNKNKKVKKQRTLHEYILSIIFEVLCCTAAKIQAEVLSGLAYKLRSSPPNR